MNRVQIKLAKDALKVITKLSTFEQQFIRHMIDIADNFPETTLTHMQNRTLNTINNKVVAMEQSRPIHRKYWEQPELLVPLKFSEDFGSIQEEESE
jgi:hypothetical protein